MARIVVGIDGSDASRAAFAEALEQARLTGADVDAIWAWHMSYGAIEYGVVPIIPRDEIEASTREALAELVEAAEPGEVVVNQITVEGDPARALLDAAEDADLIVVGTRGHGGFLGLVLGSVSYKCISHARCPVLVVPPSDQD